MVFVLTLFYIAISLLSPGVLPDFLQGIHILEFLGGLIILCCLPSIPSSKILSHPATYLVTGVLLAATLSIAATGWLGGAMDAFTGFVPIIFTFYFIVIGCTTLNRIVILAYVLGAVSLFITTQGMIAEFTGDFTSLYLMNEPIAGVALYRHRGLGVIADPNDLAQVLASVLPLLWLRSGKGNILQRVFLTWLPAAGIVVGIFYTHSRGGVLALIAVILFGLKDAIGVIGSSIMTGIFTVGILALNISGGRGMSEDDGERITLWSQALTAFKTHPVFGIGIGRFADYSTIGLTAHNSYVLCLAEIGIIGYFFWIGTLVTAWTGLSEIAKTGKTAKLPEDGASDTVKPMPRKQVAGLAHPSALHASTASWNEIPSTVGLAGPGTGLFPEEEISKESLAHSAKMIRTALVGVMVAAFFLSRTYSIIFYILLGMATALQLISAKQQEDRPSVALLPLLKKIGYVMAASVLFLYLFVRLHGAN